MFYIFIFILGSVIGSFLNVVILRINQNKKISDGRSKCPHCQQELSAKDLVPILSFIFQRGRCRYCQKKISWQYPLVELSTALIFVLITYVLFGNLGWNLILANSAVFWLWVRNLVFASILTVIFVYDLRWYLILDKITLPAMAVAFLFNLFLGFSWQNLLLAAIIGGGLFLVQFAISRGKWIGGGDIRLGALMGLMLGWPGILVGLLLSYFIGAIFGSALLLAKKKQFGSKLPFGTFLAIGALIALLWGSEIINWYLRLI